MDLNQYHPCELSPRSLDRRLLRDVGKSKFELIRGSG
jgi:hypothetical protein